jgi:hypothetical protein
MTDTTEPAEGSSEPSEPVVLPTDPDQMQTAAIQAHNQKVGASGWVGPRQVNGWHIANEAIAQLGQPFQWGGSTPGGFDSQGLAKHAYQSNGLPMSHLIHNQMQHGEQVEPGQLQPGDLVFMATGSPQMPDVTGVYVGNGIMVHSTPGVGVVASRVSHIGKIAGTMHLGSVTRLPTKKPQPIPPGLYETDDVMPHNRLSSYLKPSINNVAGVH